MKLNDNDVDVVNGGLKSETFKLNFTDNSIIDDKIRKKLENELQKTVNIAMPKGCKWDILTNLAWNIHNKLFIEEVYKKYKS